MLKRVNIKTFELEVLFVDTYSNGMNYMGKGIGSALIKNAQAAACEHGAQSIYIQSDPNAEEFYEAAGAIKIGAIKTGKSESASIAGRYLPTFTLSLDTAR